MGEKMCTDAHDCAIALLKISKSTKAQSCTAALCFLKLAKAQSYSTGLCFLKSKSLAGVVIGSLRERSEHGLKGDFN
jgi:hypothetical protein